MSCREFERRAADWLGGRLSPEQSRWMDAHRATCRACARAAEAETRLRESWRRVSAARPDRDLWPQIALRLETQGRPEVKRFRPGHAPRWAFSGAALLVAVTVVFWGARPLGTTRPWHAPGTPDVTAPPATPPVSAVTLSALTDVGQVNPAVDDPAGTNMEDVWEQIKASRKTNGP